VARPQLTHLAGRRIVVTGHSGFIGSWLCTALVALGADVVGVSTSADPVTRARADWLAALGIRDCAGDARHVGALRRAALDRAPDGIVHLAAQALVGLGHRRPYETMQTNIDGSLAVLEAARLLRPVALVHVTSDKCYRRSRDGGPYREGDRLGGSDPYSVSKAAAELVFEGYAQTYAERGGPAAASVRLGNVIGGGDLAPGRLVPDCLRALADGRPIRLRSPESVRPFQHVLDVVEGLLLLLSGLLSAHVAPGTVLNFAPPWQGDTVARLVAALATAWAPDRAAGAPTAPAPPAGFAEDRTLRLDGRRAADLLGWRHRLELAAMAERTVAWHRGAGHGPGPAAATGRQVEDFLAAGVTR
jgi:CDP-glucose 4,6-dehydratase